MIKLHFPQLTVFVIVGALLVCSTTSPIHATPAQFTSQDQLFEAIRVGDLAAVNAALARGAKVSVRDSDGRTPLMAALDCCSVNSISMPIGQSLLHRGANIHACDREGTVVLEYAINSRSVPGVRELLRRVANPRAMEPHGRTPLARARKIGNLAAYSGQRPR